MIVFISILALGLATMLYREATNNILLCKMLQDEKKAKFDIINRVVKSINDGGGGKDTISAYIKYFEGTEVEGILADSLIEYQIKEALDE